jgi:hypothetical protein
MSNLKIYESLSGAFIVKSGLEIIAGFYKKEHAEMFIKLFNEKETQD